MIEEIDTDALPECGVVKSEIDGARISLTPGASSSKAIRHAYYLSSDSSTSRVDT